MELWLIYLATGAVSGTLAGLFGVGGGLVIVPALLLAFAIDSVVPMLAMHLAVGTSLGVIVLTSLSSVRAHHRRGAVQWPTVARIAPAIVVGTLLGAAVADLLAGRTLRLVFAGFAILLAAWLAFGRPPAPGRAAHGTAATSAAGMAIGLVSALVGVGGGSMTVPFFVSGGMAMRRAVGTAAACGFPIAVGGTLGFVVAGWGDPALPTHATGYLHWPAGLAVAAASIPCAPLGARIAHSIDPVLLRRLFALFVAVLGARMAF